MSASASLPSSPLIPALFQDLFVHEALHHLRRDDPADSLALIESFGLQFGAIAVGQHANVATFPMALQLIAKTLWPRLFGHAAEISDHVLEDGDFLLFRRHRERTALHSQLAVFAVCVVRGILQKLQFPCDVVFDSHGTSIGKLRIVISPPT